jgi:AP-1 complex subunit mu
LDVYEKVNMIINAHGNIIKSEIVGTMKMKVNLSGMPELKLGLNDKL